MRALIFDTETTDLIRNRHRPIDAQPHITEFFGLILESRITRAQKNKKQDVAIGISWKEKSTWHSLFNPGIPLSKEVQRITGLDDAKLRDQPRFGSKAAELKKLIEACDIVVAHNLSFDRSMVNIELSRAGVGITWPSHQICTVEASEHFIGRRLKLIELYQHLFNEPFEGAHRAENDVRPLTRVFIELWAKGII